MPTSNQQSLAAKSRDTYQATINTWKETGHRSHRSMCVEEFMSWGLSKAVAGTYYFNAQKAFSASQEEVDETLKSLIESLKTLSKCKYVQLVY